MRTQLLGVLVMAACGGAAPQLHHAGPQIKLATVYVDNQDKALHFYTDVVGFTKKDDVTNGPFRWLTVIAPGNPDGGQLQLAATTDPAGKAYQEALYTQHQPATMLFTDDVKADYERIKARGGHFLMPPNDIGFATITLLDDTCGNLIQLTQLAR